MLKDKEWIRIFVIFAMQKVQIKIDILKSQSDTFHNLKSFDFDYYIEHYMSLWNVRCYSRLLHVYLVLLLRLWSSKPKIDFLGKTF